MSLSACRMSLHVVTPPQGAGLCLGATGPHVPAVESSHSARGHIAQKWVHLPMQSPRATLTLSITTVLLLHWKMRSPTLTAGPQVGIFNDCDFIFFLGQDSPTINSADWFLSLVHECDPWKRKSPAGTLRKMLKVLIFDGLISVLLWFCRAALKDSVFLSFMAWGSNSEALPLSVMAGVSASQEGGGVFTTLFVAIHSRVGTGIRGRAVGLLRDSAWHRWTL